MTDQNQRPIPGLMDEPPINVYPSLAVHFNNVNKAIILQQVHFLLGITKKAKSKYNEVDGEWWVYNTYKEWQEDYFPWLSVSTIKRLLVELEADGIIKSRQSVKHKSDRRKWYTIHYVNLQNAITPPTDQNRPLVERPKKGQWNGPKKANGYTETTTENTENTIPSQKAATANSADSNPTCSCGKPLVSDTGDFVEYVLRGKLVCSDCYYDDYYGVDDSGHDDKPLPQCGNYNSDCIFWWDNNECSSLDSVEPMSETCKHCGHKYKYDGTRSESSGIFECPKCHKCVDYITPTTSHDDKPICIMDNQQYRHHDNCLRLSEDRISLNCPTCAYFEDVISSSGHTYKNNMEQFPDCAEDTIFEEDDSKSVVADLAVATKLPPEVLDNSFMGTRDNPVIPDGADWTHESAADNRCAVCGNAISGRLNHINKHFSSLPQWVIMCSSCDEWTSNGCAGYPQPITEKKTLKPKAAKPQKKRKPTQHVLMVEAMYTAMEWSAKKIIYSGQNGRMAKGLLSYGATPEEMPSYITWLKGHYKRKNYNGGEIVKGSIGKEEMWLEYQKSKHQIKTTVEQDESKPLDPSAGVVTFGGNDVE